jgi:hypothetical protein
LIARLLEPCAGGAIRILLAHLVVVPCILGLVASGFTGHSTIARPSAVAKPWCAGAVSWSTARRRVGRTVRVKARVVRAYYASSSSGRPTFLDLGHPYPSRSRLTLLIWGSDRDNFPSAPERMFRQGRLVCAQGTVTLYRGVPEIQLSVWDAVNRLIRS